MRLLQDVIAPRHVAWLQENPRLAVAYLRFRVAVFWRQAVLSNEYSGSGSTLVFSAQFFSSAVNGRNSLKKLVLALAVIALSGCATYKPVPDGYQGPVSYVTDSVVPEDGSKAKIFALVEIDGNRISNSFSDTAQASAGRGFSMSSAVTVRMVPPKPMKATIRGSHATAAPIQAMASQLAGTFFSVEGVVEFEPKPEVRYVVKGVLAKESSSVWIEEADSGTVVTRKVSK